MRASRPAGSLVFVAAQGRSSRSTWSVDTKATWSIGLGLAGFLIIACGVLAILLGYLARQEASGDGQSGTRSRATLGMVLGMVGVLVSASWMLALSGNV